MGGKTCGQCGLMNSGDAMFCSKCGSRLAIVVDTPAPIAGSKMAEEQHFAPVPRSKIAEEQPLAPVEPPAEVRTTMAKPSAKPQRARRVAGAAKTMLGVPASDRPPPPDMPPRGEARTEPAPRAEAKTEEAAKIEPKIGPKIEPKVAAEPQRARRVAGSARTMLGVMPESAPEESARRREPAGMAGLGDSIEAEIAAAAKHAPDVPDTPGVAPTPTPPEPIPAPVAEVSPSEPPKRTRSIGPSNRTMIGQPAPKPGVDYNPKLDDERKKRTSDPPSRGRAHAIYPTDTDEEDALTLPKRKTSLPLLALLGAGVLGLVIGGGYLAYAMWFSGSDLRASVVQTDDGEMLEIEVPGARAGTKLRFGGHEQPLAAGRARFELSADDLALGENELAVDVIGPDGDVETETIPLDLAYRVRADLGPLSSREPAIDVIVEAQAGSTVTLDGEALELDAHGRGTRRFPIEGAPESAEGVVEHVVRYRVQPPEGETEQGELSTRIPLTTMRIDRPGNGVVTDASSVQVAGAVAPGSSVTLNGREVEVREDRFLTTHELERHGENTIEIVARAAGKAPRIARITLRRVASLETEAQSFRPNADIDYATIMQNPATYRGERVAFVGRVYNVDVRNGTTTLQVQVDDCEARLCPLWVAYPAASDTEQGSRVRVLGTVAGEQAFRSPSGQIRTVPRVDATFVLPAPS